MSEQLIELPDSWKWIKLGDITLPSDKKIEPAEIQSIPYIGLEHIDKDTGKLLGYGNSKDVKSTKSKFYSGDLLYGKLRPYLNKVNVVNFEGVCSTDILVFSKNYYISNEFLKYRFLSRDFVSYASQNVNGVQHPRINFPTLAEFSLALPPLNEQKRIVAKIEELNDRTQKAKKALDSIPQLCDRFRQSVLAAAFRGDLTADWREQNPDVEPASVLLDKIKKEHSKTWKQEELELLQNSGNQTKNDFNLSNNFALSELPASWLCTNLESICFLVTGKTPSTTNKDFWDGDIPFITPSQIHVSGSILPPNRTLTELGTKQARIIPENSILAVCIGSVGKIGLLNRPSVINQQLNALIPYQGIFPKFLYYWSQYFLRNWIIENASATVNAAILNKSRLGTAPVIIAPFNEQKQIVSLIEKHFAIIDVIHKQHQPTIEKLEKLNQSILLKAFRGELVPQDPDDEPASVLLERIRAEREKLNNSKPKSDRTSKRKSKTVEGQGLIPGLE
ncbi:restriction endonuclease subunit S [Nostoc sp.]|uniref:restriction endonuclease subunit S n=1 Tax=Nostoc sp. TaxID=1180 RepID=UPI002FF814C3